MTDHHVWRVIKHPKQHIPAIIACFIIVGSLTALTVFTANTHKQAANVERFATTQREVIVRSFCTNGITPACKQKAYTLIRGCLAYTPCRELLISGEVAVAQPALKPKVSKDRVSNPGSSGISASDSDNGSPEVASTGIPSPAVPPSGDSESTRPDNKHHESPQHPASPEHQPPPQGQETSSGGGSPESSGGTPPASSPAASGTESASSPPSAPEQSVGGAETGSGGSGAGTGSRSGLETVVGGLGEVVGGVEHVGEEVTEPVTKPLCEVGLAGVKVCLR